jgi:hypothetical protein
MIDSFYVRVFLKTMMVVSSLVYLAFAFAWGSFDQRLWSSNGRIACAACMVVASCIAGIIHCALAEEEESISDRLKYKMESDFNLQVEAIKSDYDLKCRTMAEEYAKLERGDEYVPLWRNDEYKRIHD